VCDYDEPVSRTVDTKTDTSESLSGFRAELEVFSGPLDLLLYLVKQDEVDVFEVAVSRITERYLDAMQRIEFFDVNTAAEFLVVAATLMEVKSRTLLPPGEGQDEEEDAGPGAELVRRLLQYKEFKEAAQGLEERAGRRALRHARPRLAIDAEEAAQDRAELLLEDLATWDLMGAYADLMEQTRLPAPPAVVRSEVPLGFYISEVLACLQGAHGPARFLDLFHDERTRERIVGVFLALLEMMRRGMIRVREKTGETGRYIEISLPDAS
jgi:segregation and condensation protein A